MRAHVVWSLVRKRLLAVRSRVLPRRRPKRRWRNVHLHGSRLQQARSRSPAGVVIRFRRPLCPLLFVQVRREQHPLLCLLFSGVLTHMLRGMWHSIKWIGAKVFGNIAFEQNTDLTQLLDRIDTRPLRV